jgi:hypothetical protein
LTEGWYRFIHSSCRYTAWMASTAARESYRAQPSSLRTCRGNQVTQIPQLPKGWDSKAN